MIASRAELPQMILTRLTEELDNLSKNGSNGILILYNHTVVWNLYFNGGKLVYATGGMHPVRRWNRALKQHCPNWDWSIESPVSSENQYWECHLLAQGISQRQLSPIQTKLVIRSIVQECFFEISNYRDLQNNWTPTQKDIFHLPQLIALSSWEILSVFTKATNTQQKWQTAGLDHLSPSLAPVLMSTVDSQVIPISEQKYFNSDFTLWDIALEQEKSVTEVALSLIPWVDKGILELQKIPDLPLPIIKKAVSTTHSELENKSITSVAISAQESVHKPIQESIDKSTQKQPLIACIDDSPVLAYALRKILIPAGYQMLSIPEPMRGFSQLIEHKPDLILLDLLLPNADGYSICKFLRDTPTFRNTPIIFLTERNTPIDRAHAMLVGATEFLGKPPQPEELLQMVHKYLIPI
ncbi:MAG: response regulator [Hapalosiphonaceae cyanobacterium JJU2]|nr:MAG: response regulator [Hapalosiphonaceae cyanobacterium JJU2]